MTWKTITLAIAVACTAVALVPRQAEALPANEVYRYYYSDASMTTEVGMLWVTSCYGVVNELDGRKTAFVRTEYDSCNQGPPPPPACTVHGIVVPCGYW